jgi:hypothetical protein
MVDSSLSSRGVSAHITGVIKAFIRDEEKLEL